MKNTNAGRVGKAGEESGKETSARGNSEKLRLSSLRSASQYECA